MARFDLRHDYEGENAGFHKHLSGGLVGGHELRLSLMHALCIYKNDS